MKRDRLLSLDVLRGADMILLTCVGGLLWAVNNALGRPDWLNSQIIHPNFGFSLWDIILPLFIFMSGAAIPFGMGRRLDADGRPTRAFWTHLLKRFALLWILGMIVQNNLLSLNLMTIDPFRNVLQSMAILLVVTSLWYLIRNRWVRLAFPIVMMTAVGVAQAWWGDYSLGGSLGWKIEAWWRTAILPEGHFALQPRGFNCFAISNVVIAGVFGPAGVYATQIMRSTRTERQKVLILLALGVGIAALGWALLPYVPSSKKMMSASFSLRALGYCYLLMGLFYWVVDVLKFRRGLAPFLLYGQSALFVYVVNSLFDRPLRMAGELVTKGLPQWFGANSVEFCAYLGVIAIQTFLLVLWQRRKEGLAR